MFEGSSMSSLKRLSFSSSHRALTRIAHRLSKQGSGFRTGVQGFATKIGFRLPGFKGLKGSGFTTGFTPGFKGSSFEGSYSHPRARLPRCVCIGSPHYDRKSGGTVEGVKNSSRISFTLMKRTCAEIPVCSMRLMAATIWNAKGGDPGIRQLGAEIRSRTEGLSQRDR